MIQVHVNENSGLQIVDHIRDMRPEDRARVADWFMARVRELMCQDYYPEIRPIVDELEAYAAALAGETVLRRDAEHAKKD